MKCDGLISHNWHPIMGDTSNIEEKWDKNEETQNKDRGKNGLKVGKMKKMNVRAAGGRHPPICAPSEEDLFGGPYYDNRSASRVISR